METSVLVKPHFELDKNKRKRLTNCRRRRAWAVTFFLHRGTVEGCAGNCAWWPTRQNRDSLHLKGYARPSSSQCECMAEMELHSEMDHSWPC